jgi:recombination protein RecT
LIKEYDGQLRTVMPKHTNGDAFMGLALAYVRRSPDLLNAANLNPQSLILAIRECAALGHMPMKGIYSLVPFRDKHAVGGWAVVGMEEVRGVIERIYRAGAVRAVKVNVGRENDPVLRWNPTRMLLPEHEFDEHASPTERGPLKAVYAWAVMADGSVSQVAWLNRHAVLKYRAVSRSGDTFWGPAWPAEGPWTEEMWAKTALHRLEKFVPTSVEYRYQQAAAEAASAGGFAGMPDRPAVGLGDIEDAEVVGEDGGPDDDAGHGDDWPPAAQPPADPKYQGSVS